MCFLYISQEGGKMRKIWSLKKIEKRIFRFRKKKYFGFDTNTKTDPWFWFPISLFRIPKPGFGSTLIRCSCKTISMIQTVLYILCPAFPQEFSLSLRLLLDRFVCLGHVDRLCETHLASKRFFEGKIPQWNICLFFTFVLSLFSSVCNTVAIFV